MKLSEFTSEKLRVIVRQNVSFHFYQHTEGWTLIEVRMRGLPRWEMENVVHEWHSATTVVTDVEAEAIYTGLLEKEWD